MRPLNTIDLYREGEGGGESFVTPPKELIGLHFVSLESCLELVCSP